MLVVSFPRRMLSALIARALLPLLVLALSSSACNSPRETEGSTLRTEASPAIEDSVLALLAGLRQEAFRQAYESLDQYTFLRRNRTEQLGSDGALLAFKETVVRHTWRSGRPVSTVTEVDTSGAFRFGFFSPFASQPDSLPTLTDPMEYVLPEDPPYLAPRNREAFQYRFLPDTVAWQRPTRVIEIRARPGTGDKQDLRHVRLYVDRASGELVGLVLERLNRTLLFEEDSRFSLFLRPIDQRHWLPSLSRYQTRLHLKGGAPQHFRTTSSFYGYEPVPSS